MGIELTESSGIAMLRGDDQAFKAVMLKDRDRAARLKGGCQASGTAWQPEILIRHFNQKKTYLTRIIRIMSDL